MIGELGESRPLLPQTKRELSHGQLINVQPYFSWQAIRLDSCNITIYDVQAQQGRHLNLLWRWAFQWNVPLKLSIVEPRVKNGQIEQYCFLIDQSSPSISGRFFTDLLRLSYHTNVKSWQKATSFYKNNIVQIYHETF